MKHCISLALVLVLGGICFAQKKTAPRKAKTAGEAFSYSKLYKNEWVEIGESARRTIYHNPGRMRKVKDKLLVWSRHVFKFPDSEVTALENYEEVDCRAVTARVLRVIQYDKSGKIVADDRPDLPAEEPVPGTLGDSFLAEVCRAAKRSSN